MSEEVQEAVVENVEETTTEEKVDVNELAKKVEELKRLQAGSDRAYQEAAKKAKALEEENEKLKTEKMSEAEKAKFEADKRKKELEDMERQLKSERTNFIKMKVVNELGLPSNVSDRIFGETEDDIRADAIALKAVLDGAKSEGVNEALGTISKPQAGSEDSSSSKDISKYSLKELEDLAKEGKL